MPCVLELQTKQAPLKSENPPITGFSNTESILGEDRNHVKYLYHTRQQRKSNQC